MANDLNACNNNSNEKYPLEEEDDTALTCQKVSQSRYFLCRTLFNRRRYILQKGLPKEFIEVQEL